MRRQMMLRGKRHLSVLGKVLGNRIRRKLGIQRLSSMVDKQVMTNSMSFRRMRRTGIRMVSALYRSYARRGRAS